MPHPSTSPLAVRPVAFQRRTLAAPLSVLMALAGAPASAASPFEGRYQGRGEGQLALQVFALDDGSDAHFVLAETALMNQCTGDLRGLARPSGPMTLVLRKTEPGAEETCTLTLRFSADRARARMEERDCSTYHGAACAFDGSLKRR
ncbi:hypothetical protein BHAOGJBA_4947 [Methylobacterium hispanicum]|uniref:Uncharacterized protein n=1 Tax=Methylobacterium hispanicum TaxID=270350 RepID=A0AAV4ZS47_9HYPH|nr:hypothetical protein BHAOGJBA_4947 [Methylobacterium hispanicum]